MFKFGNAIRNTLSVLSYLAETYETRQHFLSSLDIAKERKLSKAVVAKTLTILSQQGLVVASPGPGGGYRLAQHPDEVTLYEVMSTFERKGRRPCPFGRKPCDPEDPCALHDPFTELLEQVNEFMKNVRLSRLVMHREASTHIRRRQVKR